MLSKSDFINYFEDNYSKCIAISHRSYLEERCENRNLYIYGTGEAAVNIKKYLEINGIQTKGFIDDEFLGNTIEEINVMHLIDIVYLQRDEFFIIIAKDSENYGVSREKFLNLGLTEDIDFTYYTEIPGTNELFHYDVSLSFSRIRQKYEGFEVFGDENDTEAIRIVALGGSTTECSLFYVKGWVRFLYEQLKDKGIHAVVYGGGVSSYVSSQELLKLIRDVIPLHPDIVISYSGVNDLYSFPTKDEENRFKRPFITRFQVQFIQQILDKLTSDVGIPVVNAPSWNQNGHTTVFYGLQNDKTSSELWIDNERAMHALCQEFGISFFGFYQPFRFNGNYKCTKKQEIIHSRRDLTCVPNEEGEKRWGKIVKPEHEKIVSEIKKYDFITDLSHVFDEEDGIFYDTTHVYEKGNKIIAQKIFEKVFSCIKATTPQKKYNTLSSKYKESCLQKKSPIKLEKDALHEAVDYRKITRKNESVTTGQLHIGDSIAFGNYSWMVLDADDNYALVLSEENIATRDYHNKLVSITWEECELRNWLNTEFLDEFSEDEKKRILPAFISNDNNPKFETDGGKNSVDYIFLLSLSDFEKYSDKCNVKSEKIEYNTSWWWLRTPGMYSDRVVVVHEDGHVVLPGYYAKTINVKNGAGVRPAMLIKIK